MMPPETPNFHRFSEPSSTPRSSSRPVPSFLEESKTFSTKKVITEISYYLVITNIINNNDLFFILIMSSLTRTSLTVNKLCFVVINAKRH